MNRPQSATTASQNSTLLLIRLWVTLALGLAWSATARAGLTLNTTGLSYGLQITDFVSSFPLSRAQGIGPNGTTSTSDGTILVADFSGRVYRFADIDGQTASDALSVVQEFTETGSTPALANLNGNIYLARERKLFLLNANGSVNQTLLGGALVTSGGLVANPVNGHLYANSNIDPGNNLTDIDVGNNSYSLHPAGGGAITAVSLDGSTLYNSQHPVVVAYDTTTYATDWISSGFAGPLATIPSGPLAGDILGYDQTIGDLLLFDKDTGTSVVLGSGGFVGNGTIFGLDQNNDSSFLSQGNKIVRVSFDGDQVPEAKNFGTAAAGLFAVLIAGRSWRHLTR